MKNHFRLLFSSAIAVLFILSINMEAKAQFYTVNFTNPMGDSLSFSIDPYDDGLLYFPDAKLSTEKTTKKFSQEKSKKSIKKTLSSRRISKPKYNDFPTFTATDSLLLELIKKRLSVCMPLDLVSLTSPYGYRKDPFKKCRKFHDGIDLECSHSLVYTILSGEVEKVSYDHEGYGNYVVINHGKLQFLYGHLSKVLVSQGKYVDAGKVIAVSGATGKRVTGPHLHLRMRKLTKDGWKSVDPMPFIESLNDYINEINGRLDELTGRKENFREDYNNVKELNAANLYAELKRQGVKHPKIVLAQAILETGWFRSRLTSSHNNIFGIRMRNGNYQRFDHWSQSVTAYRDLVQYKFKGNTQTEYYAFLKKIGYASAKDYIYNVKRIADRL